MFIPVSVLLAQDKHNLSVEFNVNRANYKMESLNSYLGDTNYFPSMFYGKDLEGNIKSGIDYNLVLSYQPFNFIDFGIFSNYQYSSIRRQKEFAFGTPPYPTYVVEGTNSIEVNALSTGLSTRLYINKLLHLDQSNSQFLKKLQLSIGFSGGLGFSTLIDRETSYISGTPNNNSNDGKKFQYKATDFQGRTELGIGYKIGKSLFSDVGFKIGYQFFRTSLLKNASGSSVYPSGYPKTQTINLDFSGIYYGIYLKIGK